MANFKNFVKIMNSLHLLLKGDGFHSLRALPRETWECAGLDSIYLEKMEYEVLLRTEEFFFVCRKGTHAYYGDVSYEVGLATWDGEEWRFIRHYGRSAGGRAPIITPCELRKAKEALRLAQEKYSFIRKFTDDWKNRLEALEVLQSF